ncbi:hypothetical protein QNI16_34065 [Cytophagaceae bacterium YF14B1]|uniref:Uncharacterized protein n=1 Tax=Xanthocytophaga flava TaxID=3048013 RepID=A0AAE3UAH6_9BACT|nr:hypothetical protein [Xanthocytophaga flavus]MDJ1485566.1 hypothetical protein [Xanthocytophaga flavus]
MSSNFKPGPATGYSVGATICGAMNAFPKAMDVELAPIRVNNITAGIIDANLWGNMNNADREGFSKDLENFC